MSSEKWTKEQITVALWLYNQIAFGKINNGHKDIIRIALIIGRSSSALSMKMCNLASFDPELTRRGVKGLTSASRLDKVVWDEYYNQFDRLAFDGVRLIADFSKIQIEDTGEICDIDFSNLPKGLEKEVVVKQRVNQYVFRKSILNQYNRQCCITGLNNPTLLEACHIMKWSDNENMRLHPTNGLCLNTLFHKSYDNNLIGISPDYVVDISDQLLEKAQNNEMIQSLFAHFNHRSITLPKVFFPDKENLYFRYQEYLQVKDM